MHTTLQGDLRFYVQLLTLPVVGIMFAMVLAFGIAHVVLQRRRMRYPMSSAFVIALVSASAACALYYGRGPLVSTRTALTFGVYVLALLVPLALSAIVFRFFSRNRPAMALVSAAVVGAATSPFSALVGLDLICRFGVGCI